MPLQNRVQPTGEITAIPARGTLTGNRGILPFDDAGHLGTSRWKHQHWIICTLTHPRGRYHGPQPARGWTPLFFLDEAVGLAAGHRPCAYCRPEAYARFKSAWAAAHGPMGHKEMDRALHAARVTRTRAQVRFQADLADLPDYSFVLWSGQACMVLGKALLPFLPGGYGSPLPRPESRATVLTPRPTVDALRASFVPEVHPSACA